MQPPFYGAGYPTMTPAQIEKQRARKDANFVGFILIALLAAQYVVAIALRLLAALGLLNIQAMSNTAYLFLNMALYVSYLAVPALLVAALSRRRQNPFPTKRVSVGNYAVALFGGMAMAVLANYLTNLIMSFLVEMGVPYPQFDETQSGTSVSLLLNLLSTAILPALLEEMVMRGYVLGSLRRYGDKLAVVITAMLFGLIHGNVLQLPFAFFLGLVLGWLVVQTDSIWPAVLLHFGNNAMSVLLDYVEIVVGSSSTATMLTFFVFCVLGTAVLSAAFLSNRRGKTDLLRPIGNGVAPLSVLERVKAILFAPAMIVGVIAWVLQLILLM